MSVIFWARLSLMKRKLIPRLCFFWLACLTFAPPVRSERLPVKIYTSADGLGQQLHAPQSTVDGLAVAFIVLRVAHGIFYLANLGVLRTLAFAGGIGCLIAILFVAV